MARVSVSAANCGFRESIVSSPRGVLGRALADHVLTHFELVRVHLVTRNEILLQSSKVRFRESCMGWREYA